MKSAAIVMACAATALSNTASAQSTFGEFLDMGGTKVLKPEWQSILPASITRRTQAGSDVHLVFLADGTLTGTIKIASGASSPITGTWTMDDNGKRCINERFIVWSQTYSECSYMYRYKDKYYGSPTDSDRNLPIRDKPVAYEIRIKR